MVLDIMIDEAKRSRKRIKKFQRAKSNHPDLVDLKAAMFYFRVVVLGLSFKALAKNSGEKEKFLHNAEQILPRAFPKVDTLIRYTKTMGLKPEDLWNGFVEEADLGGKKKWRASLKRWRKEYADRGNKGRLWKSKLEKQLLDEHWGSA